MKVPGEAILEFRLAPIDATHTRLEQTARFAPSGIGGMLYWYALTPFHLWIFTEMIQTIKKLSENTQLK